MKASIGVNSVHLQFGKVVTDSDGEAGVAIDTLTKPYATTAVVLSPSGSVNATAFELSPTLYHVTVSTPDVVHVNYLTVSSD